MDEIDPTLESRSRERFEFATPHAATLGGVEVTLVNVSLGGAQVLHREPMRIGTRATLSFDAVDSRVASVSRVAWSHFGAVNGVLLYRSGLRLEAPDGQFAAGIHMLLKSGHLHRDENSLDRKRKTLEERERERAAKAAKRMIPTSAPIETKE